MNKNGNFYKGTEFRTTIIEDTHLTLAAIPFKVEANNSLICFAITNIREKTCRVSVPVHIYNSLVCSRNYQLYNNGNLNEQRYCAAKVLKFLLSSD